MPPISSQKRPGVLAWGLFVIAILIGAGVVWKILSTVTTSYRLTNLPVTGGVVGMDVSEGALLMGAPSIAPMPPGASQKFAARPEAQPKAPEQRVIKTGALTLRVEDAGKATDAARAVVTGKGGYVESSSMTDTGNGPRTANLTVRVPVTAFDQTMSELKQLSTVVLREDVNGQDVTMEFVDLEADLRNARAEEASYLEIMKRSGKIEEVLAVAERLADVRGRIERLDGQKRYLENRTDLATINLALTEETRVEAPTRTWKPLETLRQAGLELVQTLQGFVDFLIRFFVGLVAVLPFLAFTTLLIWLGWKVVKMFIGRVR